MTKKNLPNSGITSDWDLGAPYKTDMDANLRRIDSLLMPRVKSRTTTTPPANPVEGDSYIVASGATGAWANQYPRLAVYLDGAWGFIDPKAGWEVRVLDENCRVYYTGAAWSSYSADVLSLLNAADKSAARTVLAVPSLDGDAFTGPIGVPGATLGWNPTGYSAPPTKYLIAELESSTNPNSMARITIEGVIDRSWNAADQRPFRLDIATRGGLRCFFSQGGAQLAEVSIEIYLGPDSRYYVWLTAIGLYSASIFMRDAIAAIAHRVPAQGTPSGTLVFSTATANPRRTDYYTLKFSGTTAATQGGSVSFAHGLSDIQKIKSVSVIALDAPGNIVSSNMPAQYGASFAWLIGPTYIYVQNIDGASANMLSRPIYITVEVWY